MLRNVLRPFVFIAASFALSAKAQQPLTAPLQADRIVVVKSTHTMTLYAKGKVLKVYRVSLGSGSGGPKQKLGDHETPEGAYTIDGRNAHSTCHLALHLSYPNSGDRQRARRAGVDPGGDVEIHGLPNSYPDVPAGQQLGDWTWGCIALTNAEMEEVWKSVPLGTVIEVRH